MKFIKRKFFAIHQLREQHREELLTVLSYEQVYAFEKKMQEMRQQHRQRK